METQDIYELWNKDKSGVLTVNPLIFESCKAGDTGAVFSYPGGCIYKAAFTYLCGRPDTGFLNDHPELILRTRLVCMSPEWEDFIKSRPVSFVLRREIMKPLDACSSKLLKPLPQGYTLSPFTEDIFETHPFDQGREYKDLLEFTSKGAGAAVLYNGEVVSSASSFMTFNDGVELDVFTAPEHRKKGLADHCVHEMMRQCKDKGLTVHWDAQNPMSSGMAKGHGFVPEAEYAVYWLESDK